MSEDEKGNETGKVKLDASDHSTLALLTLLDKCEEDEENWNLYWAELLQREPFKGMDDCLQDALARIFELEDKLDKLMKVFKNHEHLHGSIVVKLG